MKARVSGSASFVTAIFREVSSEFNALPRSREVRFQKPQQLAIEGLRDLDVGNMAGIGDQHQFRSRNRIGDVARAAREVLAFFVAAQDERLDADFRPIVHTGSRYGIC